MPQESEYNGDPSFECVPQFKECLQPPLQFHDLPGHTSPCGVSMLLCACVLCGCVLCGCVLCACVLCGCVLCAYVLCGCVLYAVWYAKKQFVLQLNATVCD